MKHFLLLLLVVVFLFSETAATVRTAESNITFLENKGQWNEAILFKSSSENSNVQLLRNGISFSIANDITHKPEHRKVFVWNLKFDGINDEVEISPQQGSKTIYSYLFGNDASKWVIHPSEYRSVIYKNIYNKTDIRFYGNGNSLEFDYIFYPGSNIADVRCYYEGISKLSVNDNGDLVIQSPYQTQLQKAPVCWQVIGSAKVPVKVKYILLNDTTFGLQAEQYSCSYDLIVDPLFQMVWSSYTKATGASTNQNYSFGTALDRDGNVFLTGKFDGSFPLTAGAYAGPSGVYTDIVVAKFSKDGTTMLYSTYLPGSTSEYGVDIAVDDSGRAYVTGITDVDINGVTSYPSTSNAYQPVHDDGSDAFLTVLNADGTALVYSSFLGGNGGEGGYGIALGNFGEAYIVGTTGGFGNFPVVNSSAFPSGDNLAFVAKFDINQSGASSLIYSTKIGGGSFSSLKGRSIAVNSAGNAFITGTYMSSFGTPAFPFSPSAYNTIYNTGMDGIMSYAIKLSATLPITIEYATFLGPGEANAIEVDDSSGEAIIAGGTRTFAFPVTPGVIQPVHGQDALGNPNGDIFLMRLNSPGSALVYSTFLGGPGSEGASDIALNSANEVYIAGIALNDFPTSPGAYQPANAGSSDFIVAHLNADASAYACGGATYVGGTDTDYTGSMDDFPAPRIKLIDHGGNFDTVCVSATSHSQDFPTTPGVYGPVKVNTIHDQPVFFKLMCFDITSAPIAAFVSDTSVNCEGVSVDFTDSTAGTPFTWQWYFPGSATPASSLQHPQDIIYTTSGTYAVSLVVCNSLGCDSIADSIVINAPVLPSVSLGNDTLICNGSSVMLTADPGYPGYQWNLNGITTGTGNDSLEAVQSGLYTIVVTDQLGCTAVDSMNLIISDPEVEAGPDILLCNNDSVTISASTGYANYQWSVNGNPVTGTTNIYTATTAGNYMVMVTDSVGCTDADSLTVDQSTISVTLMSDTSFCSGGSAFIDPGSFSSYQWLLNGNVLTSSGNISATDSGQYILNVTNADGCSASDSVLINVFSLPVVQTLNDTSICSGSSIALNSSGATSYIWNPSTDLNDSLISDPVSFPADDIVYTVTGTDANGCSATDVISIVVTDPPIADFDYSAAITCDGIQLSAENNSVDAVSYTWSFGDGTFSNEINPVHIYQQLVNQSIQLIAYNAGCSDTFVISNISFEIPLIDSIPNIITPNGDNVNDCFEMENSEVYTACFSLTIFNRWGNVVFETSDPAKCWDGRSDGNEDLPAGTYYYLLAINKIEVQGSVMIAR